MAEAQVSKAGQEELLKKVDDLEKRLQTKDAEIEVYKMLMAQMEEDLAQAKKIKILHEKQTQDVDGLKSESEKTLTKAKSMIFEKTKVIKNQELQIEAFTQQIGSLKDVVRITKDLLQIRNLEVQQLETKISSLEGKQKAEKERYELMHKKLEMMIRHNAELKREYETQLCLFTALRDRYSERELAKDVVDNLKKDHKETTTTSTLDNTVVENVIQPVEQIESTTTINNDTTNPQDINTVPVSNQNEGINVSTTVEQITVKPEDVPPIAGQVEVTSTGVGNTIINSESNNTSPEQNSVKNQDDVAGNKPTTTSETDVKRDVSVAENVTPVIENTSPEQNTVKIQDTVAVPEPATNTTNETDVKRDVPVTENVIPDIEKVIPVTGSTESNLENNTVSTVKVDETVPVVIAQIEAPVEITSPAVNIE